MERIAVYKSFTVHGRLYRLDVVAVGVHARSRLCTLALRIVLVAVMCCFCLCFR